MAKLTAKQQAFINHYLITLNGTEAARLAKYKGDDNTLGVIAHENLRKPKIREEIDKRLAALTMSADEALFRMTEIARGDLSKYVLSSGEIDMELLKSDNAGHLLKKYSFTRNTTTRKDGTEYESESTGFELYPADTAIERIMKYHGLFWAKGTEDDPVQYRVKVIDYGLTTDDDTDTD